MNLHISPISQALPNKKNETHIKTIASYHFVQQKKCIIGQHQRQNLGLSENVGYIPNEIAI